MIKKLATSLIRQFQTNDPFELAEYKGIVVLRQNLGSIYGYFITYKRIKIININEHLSEELQRVVCAHELGHAILHPKISTPFMKNHTLFSVDKIEREANRFAAELLIPDDSFKESNNIYDIASIHNVPVELVRLKCEKLF